MNKLISKTVKTEWLQIRVSKEDKELIKKASASAGISEFMLQAALEKIASDKLRK